MLLLLRVPGDIFPIFPLSAQALLAELRRQKEEFLASLREAGADVKFLEATWGCRYTVQRIEIGQDVKVEMASVCLILRVVSPISLSGPRPFQHCPGAEASRGP